MDRSLISAKAVSLDKETIRVCASKQTNKNNKKVFSKRLQKT